MTAQEVRTILADYMGPKSKLAKVITEIVAEAEAEKPDGAYRKLKDFESKQLASR